MDKVAYVDAALNYYVSRPRTTELKKTNIQTKPKSKFMQPKHAALHHNFGKISNEVDIYFKHRANVNVKKSQKLLNKTGQISNKNGLFKLELQRGDFGKEIKQKKMYDKIQIFLINQGFNAFGASQQEQINMLENLVAKQKSLKIKNVKNKNQPYTMVQNKLIKKPSVKKPLVKKPLVKKPFVKKPFVKKPFVKKPLVKKPFVKKPFVKKPFVRKPFVRKPFVKKTFVRKQIMSGKNDLFNKVEPKSADVKTFAAKNPISNEHKTLLKNSTNKLKGNHSEMHKKLDNLNDQASHFNNLLNKKNVKEAPVTTFSHSYSPKFPALNSSKNV